MDPVFRALVLTTLVSTAAAFGFAVAYFRELDRRRIANIYFRRHAAQMLMDISKHWGELYHLRNELMASSLDVEDLRKEYGSDYARFLNSDEWKKMRELCHFFEMVGLCIHERLLNRTSCSLSSRSTTRTSCSQNVWFRLSNICAKCTGRIYISTMTNSCCPCTRDARAGRMAMPEGRRGDTGSD